MIYDCLFKDGKFVVARPQGFEWTKHEQEPYFEHHRTAHLQPCAEDYEVEVGPYQVLISKINPRLIAAQRLITDVKDYVIEVRPAPLDICSKPQYKYMERDHAWNMVNNGVIRVGTLYDYKREEVYGSEVGDSEEGEMGTYVAGDEVTGKKTSELTVAQLRHMFGDCDTKEKEVQVICMVPNLKFVNWQPPLNAYLYCMAEEMCVVAMKRMDKKYDTCVMIEDPVAFLRALTECLAARRGIRGGDPIFDRCDYDTPKMQHHQEQAHKQPSLIKAATYAYQKEIRALWTPTARPIEPVIVTGCQAKDFCRIVDLSN